MVQKTTLSMPFDEYLQIDAASKSRLWPFRETTEHGIYALNQPIEQTYSMLLGQALEDRVQRPTYYKDHYTESKYKSPEAKGYKKERDEARTKDGKFMLVEGEKLRIECMHDSILRSDAARELLFFGDKGVDQLTIQWEEDGVPCKARIDRLTKYQGMPAHVDLKITSCKNSYQFYKQCSELGYWMQAAHYSAGTGAIDIANGRHPTPRMFYVVAVCNKPDPKLPGLNHHRVMIRYYDAVVLDGDDIVNERKRLLGLYRDNKGKKFSYPQPQPLSMDIHPSYVIADSY